MAKSLSIDAHILASHLAKNLCIVTNLLASHLAKYHGGFFFTITRLTSDQKPRCCCALIFASHQAKSLGITLKGLNMVLYL